MTQQRWVAQGTSGVLVVGILSGAAFITAGQLLVIWRPTRSLGKSLQQRVTHCFENWRSAPLRSAVETSAYVGSICGAFSLSSDMLISVSVGTLAGAIVCIVCDGLWGVMSFLPSESDEQKDSPQLVGLAIFTNLTLTSLYLIYHNMDSLFLACTLGVLSSITFAICGRVCLLIPFTSAAGAIMDDRIVNTFQNWYSYPLRSLYELATWQLTTYFAYGMCGSFFTALQIGTLFGAVNILLSEEFNEYVWLIFSQWLDGDWSQLHEKPAKLTQPPTLKNLKQIPFTEVQEHNTRESGWMVIHGKVYDVTEWIDTHPGGDAIAMFLGADATDQFEAFHLPRVRKRLQGKMCIGEVECAPATKAMTQGYRELRERLWAEGWFVSSVSYFSVKHAVVAAFGAGMLLFAYGHQHLCIAEPTAALLSGVCCGLFLQQAAFLAHDQLHRGIASPKAGGDMNMFGWIHGSVIFGISTQMWLDEHTKHHAATLRPHEDPQFNYLPLWLISEKELPGLKAKAWIEQKLAPILTRVQHWTFLPLDICIARYNLHAISIGFAVKGGHLVDLVGMAVHFFWYCTLMTSFTSGSWCRLIFHIASFWTVGILHVQLLVSHLATETFTTEEELAEQFFAFQMKTTRNIETEWWDSWFHGGLQYQIEHHLFPQLPRHNLKLVKPMVEKLCKEHDIRYESVSFTEGLRIVLSDFQRLSTLLRSPEEVLHSMG